MSMLAMLQGDAMSRVVFILFLCLLTLQSNNKDWVLLTLLFVIYGTLLSRVPFNNPIQTIVENNVVLLNVTRIAIAVWMVYVGKLIVEKFK